MAPRPGAGLLSIDQSSHIRSGQVRSGWVGLSRIRAISRNVRIKYGSWVGNWVCGSSPPRERDWHDPRDGAREVQWPLHLKRGGDGVGLDMSLYICQPSLVPPVEDIVGEARARAQFSPTGC